MACTMRRRPWRSCAEAAKPLPHQRFKDHGRCYAGPATLRRIHARQRAGSVSGAALRAAMTTQTHPAILRPSLKSTPPYQNRALFPPAPCRRVFCIIHITPSNLTPLSGTDAARPDACKPQTPPLHSVAHASCLPYAPNSSKGAVGRGTESPSQRPQSGRVALPRHPDRRTRRCRALCSSGWPPPIRFRLWRSGHWPHAHLRCQRPQSGRSCQNNPLKSAPFWAPRSASRHAAAHAGPHFSKTAGKHTPFSFIVAKKMPRGAQ